MYKVYGDYQSGNCYKVKLMLSLLGRPYEWHPVDILKGETETPEFLAMNP
ncbi:glutathione S-transferase N-terminal domain-containing protein, partial [Pseudomonas sp. SIMBA_059]